MIIVDLETTGFSHRSDKIIEVGAVELEKRNGWHIVEVFYSRINPYRHLPMSIQNLTGLKDEDVKGAPGFDDIADQLLVFMEGHKIIGYNVGFDKRFLIAADSRFRYFVYVDYLAYLRKICPGLRSYKLDEVIRRFWVVCPPHHSVEGDIKSVMQLIQRFGPPI